MSELEILNLSKRYGNDLVLDDVTFTVPNGELVTVLGQSGSGKTTLLRSIAGFIEPNSGDIRARGASLLPLPINRRGIGIVFQNYALFPHLTVRQNVAYGLKVRRVGKSEMIDRVDKELDRVALSPYADRRPSQLSGGQQQRVAVARALVLEPSIVLFDEPLSNLDAMLRDTLRRDLRELQQRLGFTALFVTHDQREAMTLADRIAVMRQGRLAQFGTPEEVYERPAQAEVAALLGRANILDCATRSDGTLQWGEHQLRSTDSIPHGADRVTVLVRPEYLAVRAAAAETPAGVNEIRGTARMVEYQGAVHQVVVEVAGGDTIIAESNLGGGATHIFPGSEVVVTVPTEVVRVLY